MEEVVEVVLLLLSGSESRIELSRYRDSMVEPHQRHTPPLGYCSPAPFSFHFLAEFNHQSGKIWLTLPSSVIHLAVGSLFQFDVPL